MAVQEYEPGATFPGVIGRGRDASDVAMATTFGGPLLESMLVQAEEASA